MKLARVSSGKGRHVIMAVLMALSLIQVTPAPATAAGEAFTGSSAVSGVYGAGTPITDLQVSGTGNDTINVRLFVTHGSLAMSTTTGLTFTGTPTGSPLQFSGARSNINSALATLTYTRSAPGTDTLEASLAGPGEIYYPANGHLYEVVTSTLTWTNAQTAAAARTKYGATGYLATITSAEENEFVSDRLTDAGWMGASDAAIENDWKWVTGPETGTSFWSGLANGSAVSGRYENWANGEPNNAGNEDCAQFLAGGSGEWNDLPCTVTTLPRYVVEYGTSGTLPAVQSKNVAITTGTSTRTISNCTQLHTMANTANSVYDTFELTGDIDCSGISNFAPIGSAGTAWNNFRGTFDGNGHSISGLTINDPGNDGGLFHVLQNATVRDLTLDGGAVTTVGDWAGALAGRVVESVTLQNITSNVDVATGGSYAGGIIGHLSSSTGATSTITNVRSSGAITETNSSASYGMGGIIGEVDVSSGSELTLTRTAFTGAITGYHDVGGLVGRLTMYGMSGDTGLTIQDSYTDAPITGLMFVGGLVGNAEIIADASNHPDESYLTLERSYTAGSITATSDFAGGLVGHITALNTMGETLNLQDLVVAGPLASGGEVHTLFYMSGAVMGGSMSMGDLFRDGLRSGEISWTNITSGGTNDRNTTASPDDDFFFGNNPGAYFDWDFASGNLWYAHPHTYPTHEPGVDDDDDGVPDTSEDDGPNGGDANNDGTLDSEQGSVASFINGFSMKPVAVELPSACRFTSLAMRSEAQLGADAGYDYPQGLVRFAADCGTPGFTANVELYFYDTTQSNFVLRKANPARNAYYALPNSTVTQLTIGGDPVTRATYEVTDGSTLDEDATANGDIIDPAGLALGAVTVPNTGLGGSRR